MPKKKKDAFITWQGDNSKEAFSTYGEALEGIGGYSSKAHYNHFRNITSTLSARDPYTREDYSYFRPDEKLPTKPKDIIRACDASYQRIGIVHNIVDLMGDFACQGIRLIHPNPKIERFYRTWFKKIGGKDRSERILNMLYRIGNVPIKRSTAKINVKQFKKMSRTTGADLDIQDESKIIKKEIPWRYTILHPLSLEVIAPELVSLTNRVKYALKVNLKLLNALRNRKNHTEIADLLRSVPRDIGNRLSRGERLIPLDESKIVTLYYKKDDDQVWANPMLNSLLKDLIMLEKLKLTDLVALDGALSKIRVWKLGNLEHKILPTDVAVNNLDSIIANNVGGGTVDIIWGPDIELLETNTDIQSFLGPDKYVPTLNNIYAGLGIPPTLTGAATSSGFTNNFISLKTLVERLEYGRSVLMSFWENEIHLVQQAMGFRFPANIQFEHMRLSDETAEKKLLMDLADRNIISLESVLERFGEMPELEKLRLKRERKDRDKENLPAKAGPWFDPEKEYSLSKIFAQRGSVTPSEIGLELLPRKDGEISSQEQLMRLREKTVQPNTGRPKNSKDQQQRKQRTPKPRTSAYFDILMWANDAKEKISETITQAMLEMTNKKNVRSLSKEEFQKMENVKFGVLCNLEPFTKISEQKIVHILPKANVPQVAEGIFDKVYSQYLNLINDTPTVANLREIQSVAYTLYKIGERDNVDS